MKKIVTIFSVIFALMLVVACGNKPATGDQVKDGKTSADAANSKKAVAVVYSTGGKGDKSFNDATFRGLEKAQKELGITFTEKEIVKEIEKQNKDDKDNYVEKSKENDIRVNFNENRKEIFEFLSNSLMLSNALRLYEEINEYDYSIMYSKDNLEDNLKYVISNLMELIPEINNNPEYFDINSMKDFIENSNTDSLKELIAEFDNSIKETLNIDNELNEFENNNNLDNSFENNNENITKNTNNKKKEKDDLDYE